MKVSVDHLIDGCILAEDVISLSNRPIIPKKTVLNHQLIEILRTFLIKEVHIEPVLASGKPFNSSEAVFEYPAEEKSQLPLVRLYLKTVQEYKKMFQNWQAGALVDIGKVRNLIIPLLEKAMQNPREIFSLYQYSTEEDFIFHHSVSVSLLSGYLGHKMGYSDDWVQISLAGLLSDCGMAKVDPKILMKKSPLTLKELHEIKQHPTYSFQMLKKIPVVKEGVKIAVAQHHERMDGSGYPLGVKGEKIHAYAKIIAVADVYQAMISKRPYRSKQSPFRVLEQIIQDNFGKFDIQVVHALTSCLANFSVGTKVKLSNNQIAEIVFIDPKLPTRPMVKLCNTSEIIQLSLRKDLFIEEIV
jgi:HD-GYP domain-containing protein (c-di-GMP phosphodiesterase class II)